MRQIFHSEDDLGLQQNGASEGLSSVDYAMARHDGVETSADQAADDLRHQPRIDPCPCRKVDSLVPARRSKGEPRPVPEGCNTTSQPERHAILQSEDADL